MNNLEKEICEKRSEMISLAEKLGLQSHKVLAVSQELDSLITEFQKGDFKMNNAVQLYTYGEKTFKVPELWLQFVIKEYGFTDIETFLSEYTWDTSQEIYMEAKAKGRLLQ